MRGSLCRLCQGGEWCGECYEVKRGRLQPGRRRATVSRPSLVPLTGVEPSATDTSDVPKAPPQSAAPISSEWRLIYPRLWAHLTQGRLDSGELRITSTLLMFLEDGRIKLCLHDRHQSLVAFLTVKSLPDGFASLERALVEGTLEWRPKKIFRR